MVIFILLHIFSLCAYSSEITVDYIKANKNPKRYDVVPQKPTLIWGKFQAFEPQYMFEGPLRGKGWIEPFDNDFINQLRMNKIETYVDYFTTAKTSYYYGTSNKYEICNWTAEQFKLQKKLYTSTKFKKDKISGLYYVLSIPAIFLPAEGIFGVNASKLAYIEKHKYPGTNYYSIEKLINDSNLYTAHTMGIASGILQYAFSDFDKNYSMIKPYYKKRVYEFVASNAEQITLMLKARRMHWVDMTYYGDYFAKKYGLTEKDIVFLKYSHEHPNNIGPEDFSISQINCTGEDLNKLINIINIINERIKKIRTNEKFWIEVMRIYSKNLNIPYKEPSDFYWIKENFNRKIEIDKGSFDFFKY